MIGMNHYLVLSAILFAVSVMGIFLNRKNIIVVLMSIELMLLAVNFNFITFSSFLHNLAGQIFVFFTHTSSFLNSLLLINFLTVLNKPGFTINAFGSNTFRTNAR